MQKILKEELVTEKDVVNAMRLMVRFVEMYDVCMSRISQYGKSCCYNCPYIKNNCCTKSSSIAVMKTAATIFDKYLESILP